jgi:polyisoprenoid-binding protein YceI
MKIDLSLLRALVITFLFTTPLFGTETPLVIDPAQSHIEAHVKSTLENFVAKLTAYEATVAVDPAEKRVGHAQLKFHFSDIKTGNEKRDTEMRLWQQTDLFPDSVCVVDTLVPAGTSNYTAQGKLTFHGVTKAVAFPVTIISKEPGTYIIEGELSLDTRDYGLPVIRKFGMLKVNPVLEVNFHLEGRAGTGT